MKTCHACGRMIKRGEAFAQSAFGGKLYFFCCPMCLSVFKAGSVQRRKALHDFSDERVSVFVEYIPALQGGGDYACIRPVGDDKLYVIIADLSGHGVPPSLVTSRVGAESERLVRVGEDVGIIGQSLKEMMRSVPGGEDLDLTIFASSIDFPSHSISYINCGYPAQLLWSQKDRKYTRLESQLFPGELFGPEEFTTPQKTSVEIHPGDKLLLFTHGVLDLEIERGTALGEAGLIRLFHYLVEDPTDETKRKIFRGIRASQKTSLSDDLLFILLDIKDDTTCHTTERIQ